MLKLVLFCGVSRENVVCRAVTFTAAALARMAFGAMYVGESGHGSLLSVTGNAVTVARWSGGE